MYREERLKKERHLMERVRLKNMASAKEYEEILRRYIKIIYVINLFINQFNNLNQKSQRRNAYEIFRRNSTCKRIETI